MDNPYFIEIDRDDYYTSRFVVRSKDLPEEPVYIYAECSRNKGPAPDYYELELFFSVKDYARREYLIGLCFGKGKMEKSMIDQEIRHWIDHVVSDNFSEYVSDYLKKEELYEAWNQNGLM